LWILRWTGGCWASTSAAGPLLTCSNLGLFLPAWRGDVFHRPRHANVRFRSVTARACSYSAMRRALGGNASWPFHWCLVSAGAGFVFLCAICNNLPDGLKSRFHRKRGSSFWRRFGKAPVHVRSTILPLRQLTDRFFTAIFRWLVLLPPLQVGFTPVSGSGLGQFGWSRWPPRRPGRQRLSLF